MLIKKRQLGIKVWTSSFFKGIFFFENLKRIASVISNDPPCKDRFTAVA